MKNFVFSLVMLFVSFVGFSQEDTSVIDFSKISPELFAISDNTSKHISDEYVIPLSIDKENRDPFFSLISSIYSVDKYTVSVYDFDEKNTYITNILVEVSDGEYVIFLPLCNVESVYSSNKLKEEFDKVFNIINKKGD